MLIYGRVPKAVGYSDNVWATLVDAHMLEGKSLDQAMSEAGQLMLLLASGKDIGTWNPLFLNFLDDSDLDKIWFMGKDGVLIQASNCAAIREKVEVMGVGEALADSDLETYEADT